MNESKKKVINERERLSVSCLSFGEDDGDENNNTKYFWMKMNKKITEM